MNIRFKGYPFRLGWEVRTGWVYMVVGVNDMPVTDCYERVMNP
jgi:hypothetical protein